MKVSYPEYQAPASTDRLTGCLIVQVYDHRNNRKDITSSSSSLKEDRNQPYSIHNYNQYLTPSPHVPYPSTKLQDAAESSSRPSSAKQGESSQNALSTNKDAEQEDLASKSSSGPRIFTTVLFPTALSFQEDVVKCAVTPDPRSLNRKGSQIGNSRSSAPGAASGSSATSSGSGPAAKRQKLQFSNHSLQTIEANMILATAPPLYLDPVKDVKEAQALLDKLNDPHCNREHPAPKSRKRTVAELAADEALAAEEQRFMLIMDERIGGGSGAMNTGKGVGTDNEGSSTNFEANFERFKVLEEIKELNKEKKEREAQHTAQAKAKAEQDRAQERAQLANVRRQEQQEQMMRNQALRQTGGPQQLLHAQQQASVQQQGSGGPAPHAHPPTTAAMIGSHQLATTQASQSSPVARNGTPLNVSSPAVGQAPKRSGSAVPMKLTNSAQGAGSPPRPGSALQHGHPAPIPMAIQRSQQPPSRNGTPAMPNGTPRLQQGTPDIRNVTPTPRMSQASPVNSVATAATPMMGHNMIGATHMNGQQQLTPQQQQQHAAFLRAQQQQNQARQQALMAQAYHQQQQMHGSPQNIQMHQIQQQQIAAAHQAQQRAAMQPQDPEAYRHSIQSHHMNQGQSSSPAMMAMMGRGAGQHPFGNQQGGNLSMGATVNERTRQQLTHAAARSFESLRQQAMQQYGPNIPPEIIANLRTQASNAAKHWFANQQRRVMQQQHQHQQTLLNQIHQNGAMNGMGSM